MIPSRKLPETQIIILSKVPSKMLLVNQPQTVIITLTTLTFIVIITLHHLPIHLKLTTRIELVNCTKEKKGTVLLVGNSMISELRKPKLSKNRKVKVHFLSGVKTRLIISRDAIPQ